MNWKNRLTNYNFWISIFSAVLLILQALKIEFDIAYVNEIFTAVLGLLVVIGIISDPTRTTVKSTDNTKQSSAPAENGIVVQEKVEKADDVNAKEAIESELPIEEEDEINSVNNEDDIQTILTKISTSIDEKMKELVQFNQETLNKLNQKQNDVGKVMEETAATPNEEETIVASPAVSEISNPFVDIIN